MSSDEILALLAGECPTHLTPVCHARFFRHFVNPQTGRVCCCGPSFDVPEHWGPTQAQRLLWERRTEDGTE